MNYKTLKYITQYLDKNYEVVNVRIFNKIVDKYVYPHELQTDVIELFAIDLDAAHLIVFKWCYKNKLPNIQNTWSMLDWSTTTNNVGYLIGADFGDPHNDTNLYVNYDDNISRLVITGECPTTVTIADPYYTVGMQDGVAYYTPSTTAYSASTSIGHLE